MGRQQQQTLQKSKPITRSASMRSTTSKVSVGEPDSPPATGVVSVTSNTLMATHFKRVNVTTPTFADY